MPKVDIDYSNIIIYMIQCIDDTVSERFIGHTTNIVQKKYGHKQAVHNTNIHNPLYDTIRSHGGWCNWTMEMLEKCECEDIQDVHEKEKTLAEKYRATIISRDHLPSGTKSKARDSGVNKKTDYYCSTCNVYFQTDKARMVHNNTNKHNKNASLPINLIENKKTALFYTCIKCNFTCSKKSNYDRHIGTIKHQMETNCKKTHIKKCRMEVCSGTDASSDTSSSHDIKKTALFGTKPNREVDTPDGPATSTTSHISTNTIIELIKQNQEFKTLLVEQQMENQTLQKQLIEAVKDSKTITSSHTTNNNQKFNLNFFLNTTCKDAMNMSEFIQNMEIQMSELENIGHRGYIAGMTDLILNKLKGLDVSKRPMHCTDLKRETMYIKEQDKWDKDNEDKSQLRRAISLVASKNYGKTIEWREHNPECLEIGSEKYDFCFNMMRNVLGDFEEEQIKLDNKVIKNLAKEVMLDRDTSLVQI